MKQELLEKVELAESLKKEIIDIEKCIEVIEKNDYESLRIERAEDRYYAEISHTDTLNRCFEMLLPALTNILEEREEELKNLFSYVEVNN